MSLDAAFERALAPVLEQLGAARAEIKELSERLELAENGLTKPVYDAEALQELGYSYRESYAILRSHGHKRNGRLRIVDSNLKRYQTGLPADTATDDQSLPPLPWGVSKEKAHR